MISGPAANVAIVSLRPDWVAAVAAIHFESLRDDFLPSLGCQFLRDVYYPAAMLSENGVTLVAFVGGEMAGFVTVAHDSAAFSRDILRTRMWRIAAHAIRAAGRNTRHLRKSLEVLRAALSASDDPVKAEIVFIAVKDSFRGAGLGTALIDAALRHVVDHAGGPCRTKTLAANIDVIRLYERLGWYVRDRFRLIGNDYVTIVWDAVPQRPCR